MAHTYIWTNHARTRLKERKIPKKFIEQTLQNPDRTIRNNGTSIELQKQLEGRTTAAIIRPNDRGEKIIVSVWINPPFPGTRDYIKRQRYFAMKKASLLKKMWLHLLNWLGV